MIAGYTLSHLITRGDAIAVHRGVCDADGKPVVLKELLRHAATHKAKARLRYEFKLLQMLNAAHASHVWQALEIVEDANSIVLVSKDMGGESLDRITAKQTLSMRDTLHVATQVAAALQAVHALRVIHKDVNPNNIVYNASSGNVQLIDFGISTQIPLDLQAVDNLQQLEGTLAYISPEQTGRMNRLLDYRSDFYSLGATLYHLLSGQTPFKQPMKC